MLFKDAAIFALVMILIGLLLTASVFAVGLILNLFSRKTSSPRRWE